MQIDIDFSFLYLFYKKKFDEYCFLIFYSISTLVQKYNFQELDIQLRAPL